MASKQSPKKPIKPKKVAKKKAVAATKKATEPTAKKTVVKAVPKKAVKKAVKKRKKKKKTEHYVDGKVFFAQIKEYYETDVLPEGLAESICKISKGLSFAPNFINYSYKDEMVGDAVLKMWSALKNHKFNCDLANNPFSYFTTIAFHAFINRIKKEKKHRETITKYQETIYADKMMDETSSTRNNFTDENDSV